MIKRWLNAALVGGAVSCATLSTGCVVTFGDERDWLGDLEVNNCTTECLVLRVAGTSQNLCGNLINDVELIIPPGQPLDRRYEVLDRFGNRVSEGLMEPYNVTSVTLGNPNFCVNGAYVSIWGEK